MTFKNATSAPTAAAAAAAAAVAAYGAGTSANSPTAGIGFQTVVSDPKGGAPTDTEPPDLANNWILTAQHSVTFVFSFLIALASLILNSILVAGMRKDCRLRHITYYYLTSLSVAMLFLGLCDFPPSVLYELLPLEHHKKLDILCIAWVYLDTFLCNVIFLHCLGSTLDSFLRLRHPRRYVASAQRGSTILKLTAPWCVSFIQTTAEFVISRRYSGLFRQGVCLLEDPNFIILRTIMSYGLPMVVSFFMLTLSVNQLRAYRHSQKTKMRELMHAYRLALEEMEECPVEETDMEELGPGDYSLRRLGHHSVTFQDIESQACHGDHTQSTLTRDTTTETLLNSPTSEQPGGRMPAIPEVIEHHCPRHGYMTFPRLHNYISGPAGIQSSSSSSCSPPQCSQAMRGVPPPPSTASTAAMLAECPLHAATLRPRSFTNATQPQPLPQPRVSSFKPEDAVEPRESAAETLKTRPVSAPAADSVASQSGDSRETSPPSQLPPPPSSSAATTATTVTTTTAATAAVVAAAAAAAAAAPQRSGSPREAASGESESEETPANNLLPPPPPPPPPCRPLGSEAPPPHPHPHSHPDGSPTLLPTAKPRHVSPESSPLAKHAALTNAAAAAAAAEANHQRCPQPQPRVQPLPHPPPHPQMHAHPHPQPQPQPHPQQRFHHHHHQSSGPGPSQAGGMVHAYSETVRRLYLIERTSLILNGMMVIASALLWTPMIVGTLLHSMCVPCVSHIPLVRLSEFKWAAYAQCIICPILFLAADHRLRQAVSLALICRGYS